MKIKMSKAAIQAAIATTVVAVSVTWAIMLNGTNHSLQDLLNTTKLEKEKMLSEKITVEKELKNSLFALEELKGKNAEMDKSIAVLQEDISKKETALKNISFTNKKALDKEYAKLQDIKKEMEKNLADFNSKTAALQYNIESLSDDNAMLNKTIAMLENENSDLRSNLTLVQSMAADKYLIESSKGKKDKQTISAKKTDKIQISFAIPEYLNIDLRCTITTPDGKVISSNLDKGFSFINTTEDELYASLYFTGSNLHQAQNIKMIYSPTSKLKPGIYDIDIYGNKVHLGNCKIRLK
ncbi:MAG: hypothetical protein KA954_10390 [Chitinophagales bacterium]|nr:hypothetical protein [Bacteroidota bacterium]MBP7399984.1 hypothetical protein [Chitinophagales bacterium]MBK8486981.1 hypothetical protein [Bacteroidota bacterium]MBK8680350.1 hypothetical protein [Bacteroidota bacterium]MBP8753975.1 hypothetical protein [Chitinophagales bacterium]